MYNTKGEKIFYVDGLKFVRDDKTNYYLCSNPRARLHRYIYEKFNGEIPKGYQVHHKDGNKFNNNIDNLVLLTNTEHQKLHWKEKTEIELDEYRNRIIKNALPKAIEWHKSKDGSKFHRELGFQTAKKLKDVKIKKICECCGKEFFDNGFNKARFCSNNCKVKFRRISGVDNEKRICIVCGKEFTANKYSKIQTCSRSCGVVLSHKTRKSCSNK